MKSSRNDLNFKINNMIGLTIFSFVFFVLSFVYIAFAYQFDYWYLLSVIIIGQLILDILYIVNLKRLNIYNNNISDSTRRNVILITLLQILFLNVFVFISGVYTYRKITSPLNTYF